MGGLSGRVADLGIAGRDGVQLAIDLCNQAGGVDGRQVVLLVRDDEQKTKVARQVVKDLLDQGIVGLVGPMTSDMAMAVVPLLNHARLPTVSPTVTTEALSGRDDWFFRVTATTRVFASANAQYQLKKKRMRRVSATFDLGNRSFAELWLDNFIQALEAGGGKVLRKVGFTSGAQDSYFQLADSLLEPKPDGVVLVANAMDSALLCQQIRKFSGNIPITLADWGATELLLEMGGEAVEGVTVVQTFDRNSQAPKYQEFRRLYMDRFHREPGFPGVHAFEATQVLLNALAQAKGEAASLKKAILATPAHLGLQGPLTLDRFGEVLQPHVSISVVKNGKFVVEE